MNRATIHRPRPGLDAKMPQRYAQEIVSFGGLNAQAQLWSASGRHIADLTVLPGSPAAGPTGFGVSLVATGLSSSALNINPSAGDQESFYAVVSYFDFRSQGSWKPSGPEP
jgi:hypothetical protein